MDKVREKEEDFARGVWVGFTFGKNGPNTKAFSAMSGAGMGYGDDGALATIF